MKTYSPLMRRVLVAADCDQYARLLPVGDVLTLVCENHRTGADHREAVSRRAATQAEQDTDDLYRVGA